MEVQRIMFMAMVKDMERAVGFYTDVIGFRQRSRSPNWSELAFGDFTLALHIDVGSGAKRNRTGLSITVTDIESACREIAAAGGEVINPPRKSDFEGLTVALVADPEGNKLELGEYSL